MERRTSAVALDFHHGSLRVLLDNGQWVYPLLEATQTWVEMEYNTKCRARHFVFYAEF